MAKNNGQHASLDITTLISALLSPPLPLYYITIYETDRL